MYVLHSTLTLVSGEYMSLLPAMEEVEVVEVSMHVLYHTSCWMHMQACRKEHYKSVCIECILDVALQSLSHVRIYAPT